MRLFLLCCCLLWLLVLPMSPAQAADGTQLFEQHCIGCHPGGGNIIRRGKTLQAKALEKNGYAEVEAIATIIRNGKGNMSAFGDRLTPPDIDTLATYVRQQADQGWKA